MSDYSVTFQQSGTADTSRGPSPAIWSDCNWLDIIRGEKPGTVFYDNFVNLPAPPGTLTSEINYLNYKTFATASGTIAGGNSVNSVDLGGGFAILTADATAHSVSLADVYPAYKISGSPSTSGKLWFECRVALYTASASLMGAFIGLAETSLFTLATGVPFSSNTGAAITNGGAMLGFSRPTANTTTASTVYSDRATSFTTIGSGEVTGMSAYGFTKLGIKYDPLDPSGKHLRFYQDNVELTSYLTNTTIAATTNLKAGSLGLMVNIVGAATASNALYLDWWRVAQYYPGVR